MATTLPDDVLYLICDELGERRDFGTLFSCSTASKSLGDAALRVLYRTQRYNALADEVSETTLFAEQESVTSKWSIMWRTILLSCMDQTLIKYVQYIQSLDMRDLSNLLQEERFRGRILDNFFSSPLQDFLIYRDGPKRTREGAKRPPRLAHEDIVQAVGELVTQHAPMIEEITGPVTTSSLLSWIPRVPKLRTLELYSGDALSNDQVGPLIRQYCPQFDALSYFEWSTPAADEQLATFLTTITEQALRSYVEHGSSNVGSQSYGAFANHSQTIRELHLQMKREAFPLLALLRPCTSIESLEITAQIPDADLSLKETDPEAFKEIVTWLQSCHKLHSLSVGITIHSGSLIIPVLMDPNIKLRRLDLSGYSDKDRNALHKALAHQPQLEELRLYAEPLEFRDDLDTLSTALNSMTKLRQLKLVEVSTHFAHRHIEELTQHHELLEELSLGGQLGDESLVALANLKNMRNLVLSGITRFTFEAYLEFIQRLGPGNQGIALIVDMAEFEYGLSEDEQNLVRTNLDEAVGGRFGYEFYRGE